jgi:CVNH domain
MKAVLGAVTAALLAGAICVQPAHAQPVPQGSYINSCRNIGMRGDRLFANCRRIDGTWRRTALDVADCVGDIGNLNGRLSCNRVPNERYGSSDRRTWRQDDWRDR